MPYLLSTLLSSSLSFSFLSTLNTHKVTSSQGKKKKKGISRVPNICQIGVRSFLFSNLQNVLPLPPSQLMTLILISLRKYSIRIELPHSPAFTSMDLPASLSVFSPITMDKLSLLLSKSKMLT